jgi:hypothetical protein
MVFQQLDEAVTADIVGDTPQIHPDTDRHVVEENTPFLSGSRDSGNITLHIRDSDDESVHPEFGRLSKTYNLTNLTNLCPSHCYRVVLSTARLYNAMEFRGLLYF